MTLSLVAPIALRSRPATGELISSQPAISWLADIAIKLGILFQP
jgi:hypothetical protein